MFRVISGCESANPNLSVLCSTVINVYTSYPHFLSLEAFR
jgi:hypothetical protein